MRHAVYCIDFTSDVPYLSSPGLNSGVCKSTVIHMMGLEVRLTEGLALLAQAAALVDSVSLWMLQGSKAGLRILVVTC